MKLDLQGLIKLILQVVQVYTNLFYLSCDTSLMLIWQELVCRIYKLARVHSWNQPVPQQCGVVNLLKEAKQWCKDNASVGAKKTTKFLLQIKLLACTKLHYNCFQDTCTSMFFVSLVIFIFEDIYSLLFASQNFLESNLL